MEQSFKKSFYSVVESIKNIFPFQSKREFLRFLKIGKSSSKCLASLKNDRDFFLFLEHFLANLKNSHTKLGSYPTKKFFKPINCQVIFLNKEFYFFKSHKLLGKVISIDGRSPQSILNDQFKRISGSAKQYFVNQGLKFLLTSRDHQSVKLVLAQKNKIVKLILPRRPINHSLVKGKSIIAKILFGQVGYLKITNWDHQLVATKIIEQKLKYFQRHKIKSLIIDVRGNGGGDSRTAQQLAGHFFNKQVTFGIVKRRTSASSLRLSKIILKVNPVKPYFPWPIILLIDVDCFSSNEYFIAGLKDNRRAYVIGKTTGGGSGNPKKFIIPYKKKSFELFVSSWRYFRLSGQELEGSGISPHLLVQATFREIESGRDKVMELAIKKAKKF